MKYIITWRVLSEKFVAGMERKRRVECFDV